MVRVRVRLISGRDVIINMCTALRVKLQEKSENFHPPSILSNSALSSMLPARINTPFVGKFCSLFDSRGVYVTLLSLLVITSVSAIKR